MGTSNSTYFYYWRILKIQKQKIVYFIIYFIGYFIILIFCFAETLKIFLYIIGITARRKNPSVNFTVPSADFTVPSEKFTESKWEIYGKHKNRWWQKYGVSEKSTENPSERFTEIHYDKSPPHSENSPPLVKRQKYGIFIYKNNPSSLSYKAIMHLVFFEKCERRLL